MKGDGFLAEVEKALNAALGFPHGTEALLNICQRHAGTEVYIPSRTLLSKKSRDEEIRRRFTGGNYAQLALEYRLHLSHVRRIVHLRPR